MTYNSIGAVIDGTTAVHKMNTKMTANEKIWGSYHRGGKPFDVFNMLSKAVRAKATERADVKILERIEALHKLFLAQSKESKAVLKSYATQSRKEEQRLRRLIEAVSGKSNTKFWDYDVRTMRKAITTHGPKVPKEVQKTLNKFNALNKRYATLCKTIENRDASIVARRKKEQEKLVKTAVNEKRNEVSKARLAKATVSDVVELLHVISGIDGGAQLLDHGKLRAVETDLDLTELAATPAFIVNTKKSRPTLKYSGKEYELFVNDDKVLIGTVDVMALSAQGQRLESLRERFIGRSYSLRNKEYVVVSSATGHSKYEGTFVCIRIEDIGKAAPVVISWKVGKLRKALSSLSSRVRPEILERAKSAAARAVLTQEKLDENVKRLTDLALVKGDMVVIAYTHPNKQRKETVVAVDAKRGVVTVRAGYGTKEKEIEGRYVIEMV
jgi:hypothetical protein